MTTLQQIVNRLTPTYDPREAKSIVRMLLEDGYGLSLTDVCLGGLDNLTPEQWEKLDKDIQRLVDKEPVQYVLGNAYFKGRGFCVSEGVLIPRPETEELVDWIEEEWGNSCHSDNSCDSCHSDNSCNSGNRIDCCCNLLDIGTGSGCISITLALELANAKVTAWDISDKALAIAKANAEKLGATVEFVKQDALNAPERDIDKWDVIVSNPPYICNKEKSLMADNVLKHEPHLALFVPDDDPLLFYRAIAEYALHALKDDGRLFFEINEAYGKETVKLLESLGYKNVTSRKDQFGKDRMIMARKNSHIS